MKLNLRDKSGVFCINVKITNKFICNVYDFNLNNFFYRFEVSSLQLTYIKQTGTFFKLYWRIIFAVCWATFLLPFIMVYDSLVKESEKTFFY